jgi:hypothetical protein
LTLDEIDAELAHWKQGLSAAAQNLMDLNSLPTYQRLAGSNGVEKATLEGVTAERVYPALAAMGRLFQNFDDLQSTIDRANELRQRVSMFGSDQTLREVEQLLRGKSVKLPPVAIPIEQRTLSTAIENVEWITPGDLMVAMARGFTAARDAVLAVGAAWERLGMALDSSMTELAEYAAESQRWNANFPALARAEGALEGIRNRVENDPLGASDEFETQVAPVLNQVRAALKKLRTQRDQINAGLGSARGLMNRLSELHAESVACWNDRQSKVASGTEPATPQEDATIAALREWLGRLEEKFQGGMLDPIAVGLEKWNKAANECVFQEGVALQANQAPLKERNELRGRLEALQAKARALGFAEHLELIAIAAQARQLLFSRPTPMEKAAALVIDYEQVLRAL